MLRMGLYRVPVLLVEIIHQVHLRILNLRSRTEIVGFRHRVPKRRAASFESWGSLLGVLGYGDGLLEPLDVVKRESPFLQLDPLSLPRGHFASAVGERHFLGLLRRSGGLGLFLVATDWRSLFSRLMVVLGAQTTEVHIQQRRDALGGERLVDLLQLLQRVEQLDLLLLGEPLVVHILKNLAFLQELGHDELLKRS